MSDDTEEFDDEETEGTEQEPAGRKRKPGKFEREANRRAEEAETRALQAERRAAFLEAGIPNTPRNRYFIEGYQGDLTGEAITAKAVEDGFLDPPEPKVPDDELEAHDRVAQASAGGGSVQPTKIGSEEYAAEIAKANSPEEVQAIMAKYGSPVVAQ